MFHLPRGTKTVLVGVLGLTLLIAGAVFLWIKHKGQTDDSTPPRGPTWFEEAAQDSGLTFRMSFLPEEQGEKFKTNLYDHGCGLAIGDYDGDGHEDIYFCNQLGKNGLFRNKGDGTFEDVTDKAGVGLGERVCVGAVFADTLNRGCQDLYVTSTRGGNVLFRNKGNGTFEKVDMEKAGLKCVAHSQTAVFFDYDNDGYLDLFVTNTSKWTQDDYNPGSHYFPGGTNLWELATSPKEYNVLYRNNGDGTFTDVTAKAGVAGNGWGGDVAIFDYNGDGYLDLFVTNMFGANQLYRNNGDGTFTDVTKETLGRTSFGAIGCKVFDFNNDGRLDLLVVDMHSDMWLPPHHDPRNQLTENLKKKYPRVFGPMYTQIPTAEDTENFLVDQFKFRYEDVVLGNTLFKSLGAGKFAEVSDRANMETWWPWGIAIGDFDNDGFEDVFIPSGMGYPYYYWPNALMMNNGDETFTDRALQAGIEPPHGGEYRPEKLGGRKVARSSRCAVVADFRNAGRLDLVVSNFNDRPYYFRNEFPRKNYIAFRLTGTRCNKDAVGALVKLYTGKEIMVRQVQAAGGYLSQSSRTIHFGLGDRSRVDRAEILWPRRRGDVDWPGPRLQTIPNPAINTLHKVPEPAQ
jgi:hypothetical protein